MDCIAALWSLIVDAQLNNITGIEVQPAFVTSMSVSKVSYLSC